MNLVFDFGGVVFTWEPDAIIASVFSNPDEQALVRAEIFEHPDWGELDRGTLPRQEAIQRATARTGLPASAVSDLMDQVPLALVVMPESVDLLYRLKAGGQRLLYLSNMHVASIQHLEQTYPFWHLFDGGLISCHVHMIKPEPAIYASLLDTYDLEAAETVFIDDTEINLVAAERFGIKTILFQNAGQCQRQLQDLGVRL